MGERQDRPRAITYEAMIAPANGRFDKADGRTCGTTHHRIARFEADGFGSRGEYFGLPLACDIFATERYAEAV